jgi:hypothetical protein
MRSQAVEASIEDREGYGEVDRKPPYGSLAAVVIVAAILIRAYWPLMSLLIHMAGAHFFLLFLVLLPVFLIHGIVGKTYGVNQLFWHEAPSRRFINAFSVTTLVVFFSLASYFVATRPLAGDSRTFLINGLERFCTRWNLPRAPFLHKLPWFHFVDPLEDYAEIPEPAGVEETSSRFFHTESLDRLVLFLAITAPPILLMLSFPAVFPRLARLRRIGHYTRKKSGDLVLAWFGGIVAGLTTVPILVMCCYSANIVISRYYWREVEFLRESTSRLHEVADLVERLRTERDDLDLADWSEIQSHLKQIQGHLAKIEDRSSRKPRPGRMGESERAGIARTRLGRDIERIDRLRRSGRSTIQSTPSSNNRDDGISDRSKNAATTTKTPSARDREARRLFEETWDRLVEIDPLIREHRDDERSLTLTRFTTIPSLIMQALLYIIFSISFKFKRYTAALAICMLLGLLATSYTTFVCLVPSFGLWKLVIPAVLILWISLTNHDKYKLTFDGLENYYSGAPASLEQAMERPCSVGYGTISDDRALRAWSEGHPARMGRRKPKLVVVAASGGGSRSTIWVACVLKALGDAIPGFASHIRVMAGASGGMVGAAHYVAAIRDYHMRFGAADPALARFPAAKVIERINRDGLDDVAKQLVLRDLPSIFLPWRQPNDRGKVLERTWRDGGLLEEFNAFAPAELAGKIPSLIFSPMLVEDGRRLIISNLELPYMTASAARSLTDKDLSKRYGDRLSTSAVEFRALFADPDRVARLKLSTAARMNATFPYLSPAVNLPVDPLRSVVDASFYDNYGVSVASSWLFRHRRVLRELTSGVVLIQIRDELSLENRLGVGKTARPGPFQSAADAFRFFTTPFVGADTARNASTAFRDDDDLVFISEILNENDDDPFFTTAAFESGADAALSWYVSDAEKRGIERQILGPINQIAIHHLGAWWNKDYA